MPMWTAYLIGAIFALIGTILVMVLVTPEKRRASLNKFMQAVADIFNFKALLLEYIVKALYIFTTLFCLVGGFFLLFSGQSYWGYYQSNAGAGLALMILGPIVTRVTFEATMMFIILVKNVIQINNKTPNGDNTPEQSPFFTRPEQTSAAPAYPAPTAAPAPAAPETVFCAYCGTQYDKSQGGCPNGCDR